MLRAMVNLYLIWILPTYRFNERIPRYIAYFILICLDMPRLWSDYLGVIQYVKQSYLMLTPSYNESLSLLPYFSCDYWMMSHKWITLPRIFHGCLGPLMSRAEYGRPNAPDTPTASFFNWNGGRDFPTTLTPNIKQYLLASISQLCLLLYDILASFTNTNTIKTYFTIKTENTRKDVGRISSRCWGQEQPRQIPWQV